MAKTTKIKIIENIAVVYARYSSHNQKDLSIDQQVAEARKYARELDVVIVDTYEDRAVSGRTDKRPSFQRMMKDAEKGKFQYVIAWKSNRMGRNMLEAMLNEAKLQDLGIRVLYIEEDFDDTAAGRFALRSMMNVNQFYSESMAEDVVRGLNDNAKKCMVTNGCLPYGYKADENLKYVIDEPKAEIVCEIFTRVACGEAFVDIQNSLNARGIKTAKGKDWGRSSFHRILSNERYRGIYIYDKVRIEGGIPRIISDELFFKVQEVLKTKKNAQGRHRVFGDYLLTGKLFCGKCNSPMIGLSGTSKSGVLHNYYTCQKKRTLHTCDKKNVKRDDIELAIAKAIKEHILKPKTIEWIVDRTIEYNEKKQKSSHLAMFEEELEANKKAIKNIMSAIEQGIITETTKSRLMALEAEQSVITTKISALKADIIPVSRKHLIAWLLTFRDGDENDKEYQSKLFSTFLIAAYLYDDNLKLVLNLAGKNTVTIPFDMSKIESAENDVECSFKLATGSPT